MEISPEQIFVASAIGTAIVWLVTIIWMGLLKQPKPSEGVMKGIVFVTSTGLAYFWTPIILPDPSVNLFAFVTTLLVSAISVFKVAQIIYDYVWRPVTDWIGTKISFLSFLSARR